MDIDPTAPAVARGEVEVAAPRELVWDVLTDIAAWPTWSRVKSASLTGPLAAGTVFRWKDGAATITSTLGDPSRPRRVLPHRCRTPLENRCEIDTDACDFPR